MEKGRWGRGRGGGERGGGVRGGMGKRILYYIIIVTVQNLYQL